MYETTRIINVALISLSEYDDFSQQFDFVAKYIFKISYAQQTHSFSGVISTISACSERKNIFMHVKTGSSIKFPPLLHALSHS